MTDLMIEYSKLSTDAPGSARATLPKASQVEVSALLLRVIEQHAHELAAPEKIELVTASTDVTGNLQAGEVTFATRLDRRTRTLIFIGGEATQASGSVLRMTTIYRIG